MIELPSYCGCCGVPLLGGWTKHKAGCSIQKIIDDFRENVAEKKKKKHGKAMKVLKPKN